MTRLGNASLPGNHLVIDIQKGGPGNKWEPFSQDSVMTTPSGGDISWESLWGTELSGRPVYLGARQTGNPSRYTFQLQERLSTVELLRRFNCPITVRTRWGCEDLRNMTSYSAIHKYLDARPAGATFTSNLRNVDQVDDDQMRSFSFSAGFEAGTKKLVHSDITGTVVDAAINRVRPVGVLRCAGPCGPGMEGDETFWAVTDAVSGYNGASAPYFMYTTDRGSSWTLIRIDEFLGAAAHATDIALVSGIAVVVGPASAPAYATEDDIYNVGLPTVWHGATGITSNYPTRVAVTPNGTVYAAGPNGHIYKSTDGGRSYSTVSAGSVTAEDVISIAVANDNLVWFGCENGVLLKLSNGVLSTVTVTPADGSSAPTAHITTLAVPPMRLNELFLGTAGGKIWVTTNSTATRPLFEDRGFDGGGTGSVDDLQFAGFAGMFLYVVQTDAANRSRVLRDLSGGALGLDVEVVGSFTSPSAGKKNAIAIPGDNPNYGIVVGEIVSTYGFIGQVDVVAS